MRACHARDSDSNSDLGVQFQKEAQIIEKIAQLKSELDAMRRGKRAHRHMVRHPTEPRLLLDDEAMGILLASHPIPQPTYTRTFGEREINQWLSYRLQRVRSKRQQAWLKDTIQFFYETTEGEITRESIIRYRGAVLERWNAPDPIQKGLQIARSFLALIGEDRHKDLLKYKIGMGKTPDAPPVIPPEIVHDLLTKIEDKGIRGWVLIAASTGLRPETISKLEPSQIREGHETGIIHLRKDQTKTKRKHFIPILPEIRDDIHGVEIPKLPKVQRCMRALALHIPGEEDNLQPKHLRKFAQQVVDRCGISDVVANFVLDHGRSNVIDRHYRAVTEDQVEQEWKKYDTGWLR